MKLCCHQKGVIKCIFKVISFQNYYELLNLAVLGCASLEAAVVIPVLAQQRRCLLPFYWTFASGGISHEAISPNKTRQLSVAARPTYHPVSAPDLRMCLRCASTESSRRGRGRLTQLHTSKHHERVHAR